MSSEVHKYIEENTEKNQNLFSSEIINFPSEQKINPSKDLVVDNYKTWELYDKTNAKEDGDQLKAVLGICFMFSALIIMGLYSNFI